MAIAVKKKAPAATVPVAASNDNTIGLVKSGPRTVITSTLKLEKFFVAPAKAKGYGAVCSHLFEQEDGEHLKYLDQGCHANALGEGNAETTGFFTSIWTDHATSDVDHSRRWVEFITDKNNSPWRTILSDGVEYVVEDNYGWVYVPVTKDTTHQVLCHFAVATRHTWERGANVKLWCYLQDKKGFTALEAFYILSLVMSKTNDMRLQDIEGNHYPFSYADLSDWERVRDGNPKVTVHRKTVKRHPNKSGMGNGSLPMAVIFAKVGTHKVRSELLKRLHNCGKKAETSYSGSFGLSYRNFSGIGNDTPAYPDVDVVADYIKANREMFFEGKVVS